MPLQQGYHRLVKLLLTWPSLHVDREAAEMRGRAAATSRFLHKRKHWDVQVVNSKKHTGTKTQTEADDLTE